MMMLMIINVNSSIFSYIARCSFLICTSNYSLSNGEVSISEIEHGEVSISEIEHGRPNYVSVPKSVFSMHSIPTCGR